MPAKWSSDNLKNIKRYVGQRILRTVLVYLAHDPERNVDRLLLIGKLLARREEHRQAVDTLQELILAYPAVRQLAISLLRDTHPNVLRRLVFNWFVNSALLGIPRQRQLSATLGFNVPHFILVDPTSACNLRCDGCWAGAYPRHDVLPLELLDRLLREAKELGIYWIVMSGGEPFLYPHLFELAGRHPDMAFMLFTNGTLISNEIADRLAEVGNISPALSLEGWQERTDRRRGHGVFSRVVEAMERLRSRGLVFGVSLTATAENFEEITSDDFVDFLVARGARYGWIFHYIPIGRNPRPSLMLTPEQRAYMAERIPFIRTHWPLAVADFWNDGDLTGGCIAGGRRYFHITASGAVQPCAFVHFSTDNIKDKNLVDILQSPLFAAFQKRQPFSSNYLRPCPIIDVPEALQAIVSESGARPTHPGAEDVLQDEISAFLCKRAEEWARIITGQ